MTKSNNIFLCLISRFFVRLNVSNYLNRTDEELNYFYRLSTKLREGNVFIAVCLSTGVSLILYSFGRGWVSLVSGPFHRFRVYTSGVLGISRG